MDHSREQIDVTVIVAVYNAAHSIVTALKSALAQEGVNLEVLVVDDASTDATVEIVENLARREPRIRLIRSVERSGPGPARNLALAQAKGDWVAVLDADDKYQAGRLSALLAVARDQKADMVADNLWLVDSSSGRAFDLMLPEKHIKAPRIVSPVDFVRNNQPINVKRKYGLLKPIIRRELIDRHTIRYNEETPYGSDFLLYVDCLAEGAKFVLVPEAYYYYELSRSQMTRSISTGQAEAFLEHCDQLLHRDNVKRTPGLVEALRNRSQQLRSDLVYLRFVTALKKRRPFAAIGVLASRPDLAWYIARHVGRSAVLRARQWSASLLVDRSGDGVTGRRRPRSTKQRQRPVHPTFDKETEGRWSKLQRPV